ncbi:MAG: Si-specific NAD(P)(+) transhydrogenase [Myxococcales bacterium]|nr:Si-specific NAD(P)(+) transhydrogenase [Myxococcales bacterium]
MTGRYDWVVIGAGPAGQKAAIQAAKAGGRVAVVERGRHVGGECVHRGTIPSKALRETAVQLRQARRSPIAVDLPAQTPLSTLLGRVTSIVRSHVRVQNDQLERNGVELIHGRARFADPHTLQVQPPRGDALSVRAERFVVATGSVPRRPPEVPIDHEFVLDSDSILSQPYLPERLVVLGGGVIACEYATVFHELGVQVTVVDRASRPLGFMDADLSQVVVDALDQGASRYLPGRQVTSIERHAIDVVATLDDGTMLSADKVLVALGRVANVADLGLFELGVEATRRGQVKVDDAFRTAIPHILAVGDVIGFPALAATSMEQGRRAVRLALGMSVTDPGHACPVGIYTVPELASVGLTEAQALEAHGEIRVGTCDFSEVARGQISGHSGLLKLLATADGTRLLGVHVAGDSATELVHIGQLALLTQQRPSVFVDNTFNFPTMALAYRIAALALEQPSALRRDLALV